jgi:hypothetical protein
MRLSGIDSVFTAIREEDLARADRLLQEYADDLRVLRELDKADEVEGAVEFMIQPEILKGVFLRLRRTVVAQNAAEEPERVEIRQQERKNFAVIEVCDKVLPDGIR